MKFWQKAYLCILLIMLLGFDMITYLSISVSYSLNQKAVYSMAENERLIIQGSLMTRLKEISEYYPEMKAEILKMQVEPYGNYYQDQKTYLEVYLKDSPIYSSFPHTFFERPELEIMPGQKSTIARTVDQTLYYFISGYLPEPFSNIKLVYIKDIQDLASFKKEMTYQAIISFIAVFILLSVLLLGGLLKLTAPLRKLNRGAQQIAAGNYHERVSVNSRDEIGEFARSFNIMADSVESHIQRLSELTEYRQQFINNLAHEMRTPLTAILGYGESLKYANLSEEERTKAIDYIISQSNRMKNMAGKLMDLSMLTKDSLRLETIDLKPIVESVLASLLPKYAGKNISITTHLKESKIIGDKDLMESLIQNLVENAIQAIPRIGEIRIATTLIHNALVLTIEDNGVGMSETDLQRVFEPFYRADKSRSRANGGAGLGLALCRQICDLHDAKINVVSKIHEGTVMEIKFTTLPQVDDNSVTKRLYDGHAPSK
jgi:signal transduction histidine kinase